MRSLFESHTYTIAIGGERGAAHDAELRRRRSGWIVLRDRGVVRLLSVGAPVPFDSAADHIDHGDAVVAIAVGDVGFVRPGVEGKARGTAEHRRAVAVGWLCGHANGAAGAKRGRRASRHAAVRGVATARVAGRRRGGRALAELGDELPVRRELQDARIGAALPADPHVAFRIDGDRRRSSPASRSPHPCRRSGRPRSRRRRTR